GDHDAERGLPSEYARGTALDAGLHILEVHDERVCGEQHDEDAEADAHDRVRVAQAEHALRGAECDEADVDEREHSVADHADEEDLRHLGGGAHLAAEEQGERDADDAESAEYGLRHDVVAKAATEYVGDSADEEALCGRVGEDEPARWLLLEDVDEREHEAGD